MNWQAIEILAGLVVVASVVGGTWALVVYVAMQVPK